MIVLFFCGGVCFLSLFLFGFVFFSGFVVFVFGFCIGSFLLWWWFIA